MTGVLIGAFPLLEGKVLFGLYPLVLALLPLVLVVGVNALFTYLVFPALDLSFMAERFASLDPSRLTGLWALLIALLRLIDPVPWWRAIPIAILSPLICWYVLQKLLLISLPSGMFGLG